MKAKELMIGDLVFDGRGAPARIQEISDDDFPTIRYNLRQGEKYQEGDESPIEDLKPIPITPEILEKNGFSLEYDGYVFKFSTLSQDYLLVQFRHNGEVRRVEGEIINQYGFNTRTIMYVHQLQHQMKLMGIEREIVV